MPPQGVKRYIEDKTTSPLRIWRFNNKIRTIPAGKALRVELSARGVVHWTTDKWLTVQDSKTAENAFGVHLVDLPVSDMPAGNTIVFTFFWPDTNRWENVDFSVGIDATDSQ